MAKNKTPQRGPQAPSNRPNISSKTGNGPTKQEPISTSPVQSSSPILKSTPKKPVEKLTKEVSFIFNKENYTWMFIGIAFLILGFFLMSGTTDIMSSTKIVIAPLLVLIGFGIEFYAILLNPAKKG